MTQTPPPSASAPQASPYPVAAPPSVPAAKLSAAAVCALVASAVALVPVGVVLGIVALFRTRRLGQRGRRLAVVALSLCAAWTAMGMVAIIATATVIGSSQGPLTTFGAGTCFTYQDGVDTAQGVDVVSCSDPHDGQIVADHGLGSGYPGLSAASKESVLGCLTDAAHAIPDAGRFGPSTRLRIYYPSQDSWDGGMHSAVCVLTNPDRSALTGDALAAPGLTPLQRQVLGLTNESVLLRIKLHDVPQGSWQIAGALEQRLGAADRAESAGLGALAANPPQGTTSALPPLLRALAAADATEASQADAASAAVTGADAWQALIDGGRVTYAPAAADYQELREPLGLPQPGVQPTGV
ncbi:septum formation family protein [Streptacidiphilus neutrinimicus]|uniref:septum formation family protein n=1 Tax=Streptacidiphilus neutrinimicus TaxID=105420 RepID=UPI0005A8C1E7|nr:septum formation family protein [Streptacidiphilus neutrinimicus]